MPQLTDEQKREVCLIVAIGCAWDTAARYAGCRTEEIGEAALTDEDFARELARADASAELAHMRAVREAARDERHWRASVWWLERRLPDIYARRQPDSVSPHEVKTMLTELSQAILAEVASEAGRDNLLKRINQLIARHEMGELASPDNPTEDDDLECDRDGT